MQVKVFLRLEVSIPYDLHRDWRPGYVHCAESAEQGTDTLSLTLSLTKIWNRKWVWARFGGQNHRCSLHYLIDSYYDYGTNAFLLCLEVMASFWLIEYGDSCLFSRVPGPNSTQIFSLWFSTHQAMCTLIIRVFAITKTIIHGLQKYVCRNVTYRIETSLTWYAIDDVKLHYTTPYFNTGRFWVRSRGGVGPLLQIWDH